MRQFTFLICIYICMNKLRILLSNKEWLVVWVFLCVTCWKLKKDLASLFSLGKLHLIEGSDLMGVQLVNFIFHFVLLTIKGYNFCNMNLSAAWGNPPLHPSDLTFVFCCALCFVIRIKWKTPSKKIGNWIKIRLCAKVL